MPALQSNDSFKKPFNTKIASSANWRQKLILVYSTLTLLTLTMSFIKSDLILLISSAIYFFIFLFLYNNRNNKLQFDIISPISLSLNIIGFYFVAVMCFSDEVENATAIYLLITVICFLLFTSIIPNFQTPLFFLHLSKYKLKNFRSLILISLIMIPLGMITVSTLSILAGLGSFLNVFSNPLEFRSFISSNGMTYIKFIPDLCIIGTVKILIIKYYKTNKNNTFVTLYCLICFLFAILYATSTGYRSMVVFLIADILVVRYILKIRTSFLVIGILTIIVISFIAISGEIRIASKNTGLTTAQAYDLATSMEPSTIFELFLKRFDAFYFFNALIKNHHMLNLFPRFGSSYLEIFLQPIPRSFWENKPLLANNYLTKFILPDQHDSGVNYDFSIFGESFLNFSWAGAISTGLILAYIISILQKLYEISCTRKTDFDIVWISYSWLLPTGIIVSGIEQTSVLFCLTLLSLLIILKIFFTSYEKNNERFNHYP